MAAEAEASREARAKVIAADGEMRASRALKEASSVIDQSPSALQLRYLQASERASERGDEIRIIRVRDWDGAALFCKRESQIIHFSWFIYSTTEYVTIIFQAD